MCAKNVVAVTNIAVSSGIPTLKALEVCLNVAHKLARQFHCNGQSGKYVIKYVFARLPVAVTEKSTTESGFGRRACSAS